MFNKIVLRLIQHLLGSGLSNYRKMMVLILLSQLLSKQKLVIPAQTSVMEKQQQEVLQVGICLDKNVFVTLATIRILTLVVAALIVKNQVYNSHLKVQANAYARPGMPGTQHHNLANQLVLQTMDQLTLFSAMDNVNA